MSEGWEIRAARAADAAELARLAGLLGYPSDAPAMRARLARMHGSADHWIAVAAATATSTPAAATTLVAATVSPAPALGGWMHVARHITLESAEFAELLGLVVDTSARRGGVGRQLVAEAERWARVQRLARLTVRSNAARTEAHDFYAALGFERVKIQQVYSKVLGQGAGSAV